MFGSREGLWEEECEIQIGDVLLAAEGGPSDKAVKSDDAAVPVYLWNERVTAKLTEFYADETEGNNQWDLSVIEVRANLYRLTRALRRGLLGYWKRKVERDFLEWFKGKDFEVERGKEVMASGLKAIEKAKQASWWNWDKGSAIFFWRWPEDYQETVWIGVAPMFEGTPPQNRD